MSQEEDLLALSTTLKADGTSFDEARRVCYRLFRTSVFGFTSQFQVSICGS